MGFPKLEQFLGRLGCFLRGLHDTAKEEPNPALPIARASDGHQAVVVLGAMELEVVAQVEQGLAKDSSMNQEEGIQQSTHSAVAVKKGMDRLELGVRQANFDEGWIATL